MINFFRRTPPWARDLWLFLVTCIVLATAVVLAEEVQEQKEGRKIGTTITCIITSSILQGSHSFIVSASSQPLPPKVEHRLIEEGYPSKVIREGEAEVQADAYTKAISDAVVAAVGKKARGLITENEKQSKGRRPAGSVNCSQLKTITKAK